MAIAFALLPRPVSKVVIGMVSSAEVERNMPDLAAAAAVPEQLWREAWGTERLIDPEAVPFPCS